MQHFSFGHTILPQKEDSDELNELFTIGGQPIVVPARQSSSSDDQKTPQQREHKHKHKKDKGQKKQKKQKKEKKEKKEKKVKKEKKEKKEKRDKRQLVLAVQGSRREQLLVKYGDLLQGRTVEQRLSSRFQLGVKLGEGALQVDVIRFPQHRLYQYGPMDKEIPRYRRHWQGIIGWEGTRRKARQLVTELNRVINQQTSNPLQDEISSDRYFHYEGYNQAGLQPLGVSANEDEKAMQVSRDYTRRIRENPKDVQAWLQFVKLQEELSRGKGGVAERRASILQKALQANPAHSELGLFYMENLLERKGDRRAVVQKCLSLLKANPWYTPLWVFYLRLSINHFSSYSHAHTLTTFEQIAALLRKTVQNTKSAAQVWRIRKAGLAVVKTMVQVFRMEGYGQLATGFLVALVEFNVFMPEEAVLLPKPEDKLRLFRQYWEDPSLYKLGETKKGCSWTHPATQCPPGEFIGHYKFNPRKEKVACLQEMRTTERNWRMANAVQEQAAIQQTPQSFILYEDIQFGMMLYRDAESLPTLLDTIADHLGFPLVFSATSAFGRFGLQVAERILREGIAGRSLPAISFRRGCSFWWQFWDPSMTDWLLQGQAVMRLEYLRRILTAAKQQMPTHKTTINHYLSFLACALYLSPRASGQLGLSEDDALGLLREILEEEPLNVGAWSMYIEASFAKRRQAKECLDCYMQLLQTVSEDYQTLLHALALLREFDNTHQLDYGRAILAIYKQIALGEQMVFSLEQSIHGFDCLLLEQYFRAQMEQPRQKEKSLVSRCSGPIFLLHYIQQFPSSQIRDQREKAAEMLFGQLQAVGSTRDSVFLTKLLYSFGLLTASSIIFHQLLVRCPTLGLVEQWVAFTPYPLPLLVSHFHALPNRNLALWMAVCAFAWTRRGVQGGAVMEWLCAEGVRVCWEGDQHPEWTVLFNEILRYDVHMDHRGFLMESLQRIPYSKNLYLLNLLAADATTRSKLTAIMQEKAIRILDPSILHHP